VLRQSYVLLSEKNNNLLSSETTLLERAARFGTSERSENQFPRSPYCANAHSSLMVRLARQGRYILYIPHFIRCIAWRLTVIPKSALVAVNKLKHCHWTGRSWD